VAVVNKDIRASAFRYFGGKFEMSPWIIEHMPPHHVYIDPCGGAANVLLRKERSPVEIYNDLNSDVVNFFRQLRDNKVELLRLIALTPWSREEFELSLVVNEEDSPLERARKLYIRHNLSIHGGSKAAKSDWKRWSRTGGKGDVCSPWGRHIKLDNLYLIAERLHDVIIENRDWHEVVSMSERPDSLVYLDPPYLAETRTQTNRYEFEWSDDDHREAADFLQDFAGMVIISGYNCPLYKELYEDRGWTRLGKAMIAGAGVNASKRIESIWLSPAAVERSEKPLQTGLFD
jgi:DNA adenine methylase